MTEQKEIIFVLLILAAPHLTQQLALWIGFGIVISAVLLSDAVANAVGRVWRHMFRQ